MSETRKRPSEGEPSDISSSKQINFGSIKTIDYNVRLEQFKNDLKNNYNLSDDTINEAVNEAERVNQQNQINKKKLDQNTDPIFNGYMKIWNKKNDKKGYIDKAPKAVLKIINKEIPSKMFEVSSYGFRRKPPQGMIDAKDIASAGIEIDVNSSYEWSNNELKKRVNGFTVPETIAVVPKDKLNTILKNGAIREFKEETGIELPNELTDKIGIPKQINGKPMYEFTIEVSPDQYESMKHQVENNLQDAEISNVYAKKYLKYKKKYLQLKEKLNSN